VWTIPSNLCTILKFKCMNLSDSWSIRGMIYYPFKYTITIEKSKKRNTRTHTLSFSLACSRSLSLSGWIQIVTIMIVNCGLNAEARIYLFNVYLKSIWSRICQAVLYDEGAQCISRLKIWFFAFKLNSHHKFSTSHFSFFLSIACSFARSVCLFHRNIL